jgi:hypothetical protein
VEEETNNEKDEEYEDDNPKERVFFTVQFKRSKNQKHTNHQNGRKKIKDQKKDQLPELLLVLDCQFASIIIDNIYSCEDFVLTNEGIYLNGHFHTWQRIQHLNQQLKVNPPKKATWVYNWKGPRARCWCQNSLYSLEDACYSCQSTLITYQSVCQISPVIIAELSKKRYDDDIIELFDAYQKFTLTNQPYNQLILEKVVAKNDRQLCHYCRQKTYLEYEQITKEVEYYHTEVEPEIKTMPETIKMKFGTLPTELKLPLLRFLV